MKNISSTDRRELRKNLYAKYGGMCAYCHVRIGRRGTVDHYLPYCLGGTDEYDNLRWSCFLCNQLKGDLHPETWEMNKPPSRRVETKYDKRVRLLSSIAQRGHVIYNVIQFFGAVAVIIVCGIVGITIFELKELPSNEAHCSKIVNGEERSTPCKSVRSSEGKPRS